MMAYFKNKWYLLILIAASIIYCLIEAEGEGDFYIFMWAAGELSKHVNIYDHGYLNTYSYYYSVLFALCLQPFYFVSFYWVKFCWLLLNLSLFFHLCYLLLNSELIHQLTRKQRNWFYLISLAFAFRFLHDNIHHGQITILILWTCIYGIYSIYHHQSIKGSILLAIGINIKLFPLVFLPYLIYRGFFKEVFYVCLCYIIFMCLPSLIIGHEYNLNLLKSWWNLVNPTKANHVLDVDERSFHGLSTLLSTLLVEKVPDYHAMDLKRNILDLPFPIFEKVLLSCRLILLGFCVYFLRWPPFIKAKSQINTLFELAYILLIIPLIFPHQQYYAFLFTAPAFLLCLFTYFKYKFTYSKVKRMLLVVTLIFIFIVCTIKFWLGHFNQYYDHFKILTYGAIMLIPLLSILNRSIEKGKQFEV